jgi:hypothetical protein
MRRFGYLVAGALLGACGSSLGSWEGEVPDISPIEREAFAKCGRGKVTADGGRRLHRTPYLQSVTGTSATVVWAAWPDDMWVEAAVAEDKSKIVATAPARFAGDPARERVLARRNTQAVPPANFYLQRADLQGLEADTLYCYRLMTKAGPMTEPAPLLTAPPPGQSDPITFVMLGDTGSGTAAQQAIARRIGAVPFELMVFLGDIAYQEGTAEQLQSRFFEVYRDYLPFAPAYTAIGNHERRTRNGAPYREAMVLPGKELYYSFDWGDVHFVAIDTTGNYRAQIEWLKQDLSRNQQPFVIVFGHHPMYSNSRRGPHMALRNLFWPLLAHYGVNLVVMGHEHHYERFAPRSGIVHVVSGGGGGGLTRLYAKTSTVAQRPVHHFLSFEVTKDKLTMRAIDIEGKEFDRLELPARRRRLEAKK